MLRLQTPEGWFLIRHPDHARLAGQFAEHWGNVRFRPPEPRTDVLEGISRHDDGWAVRDSTPWVTRQGKPSAFGSDLVGKYTAFEEIDLPDYLRVRGEALEVVARDNPYAAILISLHTCNLLTVHADRSTIKPAELPLLDRFVERQLQRQAELAAEAERSGRFSPVDLSTERLTEHFRLLQACDNMSLLSCVDFSGPATLLHPLPLRDGGTSEVAVQRTAERTFHLSPWPFQPDRLEFSITGRRVSGHQFDSHEALRNQYNAASMETLSVTLIS
jgi:hypothetical protein